MPRIVAASSSSFVLTRPRLSSGTSVGSLMDPRPPLDAQMSTTRAPASARRASVPPHASDSSSGCAKIARTVRPASVASVPATLASSKGVIQLFVFRDHPLDTEARDGMLANAASTEGHRTWEVGHHSIETVRDDAGDTVVYDFTNRS